MYLARSASSLWESRQFVHQRLRTVDLGSDESLSTLVKTPNPNFENAKKFGAIMTVTIRYRTRDEHDRLHDDVIDIEAPATVATNDLAIRIHHQFLDWAQTELHDVSLVSAVAKDKTTGVELFRAQDLSPVPPRDSVNPRN